MQYRLLGQSGINVSRLCLGTMMFGDRTNEKEAADIVAAARDQGVNFIDTADVYSLGESERLTGRIIAAERQHWVLATKVGNSMARGDANRAGLSRRWLMQAIDGSLQRLGTDHIDIWYLHRDDRKTPLEVTVAALGDIIRSGKIRHFGLSNFRAWRIAEVVRLCEALGVPRPAVCQPYYNAMNRMPEVEVLPACAHYGLGVASYSPIARGVLSGKYAPGASPDAGSRAGRNDPRMMETEWREESIALARQITDHIARRGASAAGSSGSPLTTVQFAVNWVLNNRLVTAAIVGPRTLAQIQEYLGSFEHAFTAEDEALVSSLVAAGHPSTPGYTDPSYPVEGRQPFTD